MTELEKIKYAKKFVDDLANGINPIDGSDIPADDIMNNVRLSRCMFYVSDILRQVIEKGGINKPEKTEKVKFSLTPEQMSKYQFDNVSLPASIIAKKIYELAENKNMAKLTYRQITTWLMDLGLLAERERHDGKKAKYPTEEGRKIGIIQEKRENYSGEYTVVLYDDEAQRLILDNIDAIASL